MKTFSELQIGDKIFIWDYQKKIADIGAITHIARNDEYMVCCYHSTLENINTIGTIILSLNQCIGTYTYNIRSQYYHYFVSTYIDPILQLIEENENIW